MLSIFTFTEDIADMDHAGVVPTVLRGLRNLVRGLDDTRGSRLRALNTTLGSLLLYNCLVLVHSYHGHEDQYVDPDETRRSKQQFMDVPLLLITFCCIAIVVIGWETVFSLQWLVLWRRGVDKANKE